MADANTAAVLKSRSSLRLRLVVFLLAALLPLWGLSIFQSARDSREAMNSARTNLQFAASLAAGRQEQVADTARQLLTVITTLSERHVSGSGQCGDHFERLRGRFPAFANFGIIDLDGHIRCHGLAGGGAFAGDRAYFREALATRRFTIGEFSTGRLSRAPVIVFALPIIGADDRVAGVAFAALRLDQLSRAVTETELPPGGRIAILDRKGTVLATSNPEFPVGRTVANPALLDAIQQGRSLAGEGVDALGEMRVFAMMPGHGVAQSGLFVLVNMSQAQIIGTSRRLLAMDLSLLALMIALGGWLAWVVGGRAIVIPTGRILEATRRLQTGELDVRVPQQPSLAASEFTRIADAFNQMATSLQERQQALQQELARSQQAHATLQLVINNMHEGLVAADPRHQVLMINATAAALFPDSGLALPFEQWPRHFGLYLPGQDTPCRVEDLPLHHALQGRSGDQLDLWVRNDRVPEGRLIRCSYRPMIGAEGIVGGLVVFSDITERSRTESELLLLRKAVGRLNDMVIITEAEPVHGEGPRIVFVNEAFERLTGYRAVDVIGKTPRILQGPQTDRAALDRIGAALDQWQPVREELLNYRRDGQPVWLEVDIVPLADDKGWYTHWIAVERDITGRKSAQLALQQSEQRYMALFEQAPLPMWVFERDSLRFLAVNDAAVRQYGYSREAFLGMTLRDIRPASEVTRLEARLASFEEFESVQQWAHRRQDGSEFPVDVVSRPVTYAGLPARFVVAHDITARVRAEAEVSEHLFTLQRAADAAQAIVQHQTVQATLGEVAEQSRAVIRAHQCVVSLTQGEGSLQRVYAVSMSEKYATFRDYAVDTDGTGIYALVCETNKPMRLTQAELEAHPRWRGFGAHAANHPPMRGWLAVPLVSRQGINIGVLQLSDKYDGDFTQQDEYVALELAQLASSAVENARLFEQVTELNSSLEKKVAERTAELGRQEALFRALAEQAPQVVWTYEDGRGVTFFNRAWYELMGGSQQDWTGSRWLEAIHPDDRAEVLRNWRAAEQNLTPYSGIRRLRTGDGAYHTMAYRAVPVRDTQGQVTFWVGIDADISELKAAEEALQRSNRELEAFSYSVSHDLRSPLNTIDGFSRLLGREIGEATSAKAKHYLSRIQSGVAQMGQLIEDLLSLAQLSRAPLRHEAVDLSAMARDILEQWCAAEPLREVRTEVEDGLVVHGDSRLIRVVMDNLLGNAWKFTSRRERAVIAVGRHGTDPSSGDTAFFVRDNGVGFDMAYAGKLFQTFQRLHAAADFPGTGVGLATVSRVVARHGGQVWAEAAPDAGATIFVVLPRHPPAHMAEQATRKPSN